MIFTARVIKSSYAEQPQFIDYAFRETGAHTGMTIYSWEAHFYSFQYELIGSDHLELERMIQAEIGYRSYHDHAPEDEAGQDTDASHT